LDWPVVDLALVRLHELAWQDARALFLEALSIEGSAQSNDRLRIPICLAGLAFVAAEHGDYGRAVRVYSAAQKFLAASGPANFELAVTGPPFDRASSKRWLSVAKSALGRAATAAALAS